MISSTRFSRVYLVGGAVADSYISNEHSCKTKSMLDFDCSAENEYYGRSSSKHFHSDKLKISADRIHVQNGVYQLDNKHIWSEVCSTFT